MHSDGNVHLNNLNIEPCPRELLNTEMQQGHFIFLLAERPRTVTQVDHAAERITQCKLIC